MGSWISIRLKNNDYDKIRGMRGNRKANLLISFSVRT
ncbi:MAG: hypothetical protein K0R59_1703 [Sphingobacterium sp.]|jgi:hypothetical protein|nr:hypothetical protein [Sphingobacterium sp.]